jgi:beta-lactamase superfamily II metal-dependent hydrolase
MPADRPTNVRIRSYNVGFGDCFLLTWSYANGETRNVLIDFGSTELSGSGPKDGLVAIAEHISAETKGKLDVVVATHRHADHISGFGGKPGKVIASLKPELVVQPWTEDPNLEPDAQAPPAAARDRGREQALVSRLSNMQAVAAAVLAQVPKLEASASVRKTVRQQLQFLGETNLQNAAAVKNLMTMGKQPPVYASFGTTLPVAELLPGIGVDVLGPPTLQQSAEIATQRLTDPDEFWHLAAMRANPPAEGVEAISPLFPDAALAPGSIPQEARWVIPEIERMRSEEMLAIVRILDSVLNNTSLILLFQVGDIKLLFPGDAQIENWTYALFTAPNHAEIRERLAGARFYKVGHHGSLNATPKTLWNAFAHRNAEATPDRLVTMVSTRAKKHGSEDRGTEVPRKVLLAELRRLSDFHDTEDLRTRKTFWNDVELEL